MTDNVISFETAKSGCIPKQSDHGAVTQEQVNGYNKKHLDALIKSIEAGDVRSLLSIAINFDGSINWIVSGSCSNFEFVAALESTKFDFMNAE